MANPTSIGIDTIKRAATTAAQNFGFSFSSINENQLKVFSGVIHNRDVFAIIPTQTGFECFCCLPSMFDELLPLGEPSIIVIVTPLITEIKDQVCNVPIETDLQT